VVEALLDNSVTVSVISSKFMRKNKFKKKRLERLMYMRNIDGTFNYEGPIEYTLEVELFYRGYKERTEIYMIGGQKWSVILGIPWLACHNPKIN